MADKKYIESEAFLEDLKLRYCKDCNSYNGVYCRACWVDDMFDEIEDAPAADVVEVVRCKECKNYTNFDAHKAKRLDFHFCKKFNNITRENDFCSYGERKK